MFVPAWPGQRCSLGYTLAPLIEKNLGISLTGEQALRVLDYYELDTETGARMVRRAALRRPKGAGKSPEGAYCGFAELVLPVMFDRWEDGQPVGRRHHDPWIQFAAVSEDQTDNVMVWLFDILADRSDTCSEHGIDLGRTRIYLKHRSGRMEPVTAAAGSREGQRITFVVMDQTESWFKENGGRRLADTLRRNVGKLGGWSLELQNAPALGDQSVADQTGKASDRRAKGVLFDSREHPKAAQVDLSDREALREVLEFSYGESARWVDLDRLLDEIADPDTDPADARRYYLNAAAPSSDWAFDRDRWAALAVADGVPAEGELIVAGFDGARHDDATALVGVGVESGTAWTVGIWERPEHVEDWEVDETVVTAALAELFERWKVWRVYADPPWWESSVAGWQARFVSADKKPAVFPWYTNQWRRIGYATRGLASAIRSGEIAHHVDGDDDVLSRHVRNAVRRPVASRDDEGRPLWTLSKPAPGRKIDAAMALTLAWEARTDAVASGFKPKVKGGAKFF